MRFPSFLAIFLLVVTVTFDAVFALPFPNASNPPPRVPSVEELMEKHMIVRKDKALFYTGAIPLATRIAYQQATGLETMRDSWKEKSFIYPYRADQRVKSPFFYNASVAMAKMVTGKVHVLMPEDCPDSGRPTSAWHMYEWPYLQREGIEVIRVNVDKSGKVVGTKRIWPKGQ